MNDVMKRYCLVIVCMIFHFSVWADNVREILAKVPYTSLPFACTKALPYPHSAWGYPYGMNMHFSIEMNGDLGLTQKEEADPNTNCLALYKFKLSQEKYTLVAVGMDISEYVRKVLVIYQDGEFVDCIESEVNWWSEGAIYVKQWRITSDEEIIVTWLKVQSSTPISAFSDFSSVNAQRVDMHYQIDGQGKFQLTKEVKYVPRNYTRAYLTDKTKNLWEGGETPIEE